MHTHLVERIIARRLRAAADDSSDVPYDWPEFQRRRHRATLARALERRRPAAIALAAAAAALVVGFAMASLSRHRALASLPTQSPARVHVRNGAGSAATVDGLAQQRTRELEGWLAGLPRDPAVVRVGAHAAVISLQDQIATLDDLMSAERVAGAQPSKLGALERQRGQLVSSLAQLRYAELLASSTP
ncbi:MAG: hypothetical protein WBW93_16805, partial [Steroidobacteraceae bacterium]